MGRPQGSTYEKLTTKIEELKTRDGVVIAAATEGDEGVVTKTGSNT